jgi:hypothetical protein
MLANERLSRWRGTRQALGRRAFLRRSLSGAAAAALHAQVRAVAGAVPRVQATEASPVAGESRPEANRILLAYFSRAGENYYNGDRIDLEVGNTEV